jgi:2-polyprenyl-3-methyl-5-hydroxy-6-metoxy-1,4-benzoquinol methylase
VVGRRNLDQTPTSSRPTEPMALRDTAEAFLPPGSRRRSVARRMLRGPEGPPWEPPNVPAHLIARHRSIAPDQDAEIARSIRTNFFETEEAFAASGFKESELTNDLHARLRNDRANVVPWLESFRTLDGARILEVGAGTGASTAALAEQGARVTAVDVHAGGLRVAELLCGQLELSNRVTFVEANATDIDALWEPGDFDLILFFASLEHMTLTERLDSLRKAWAILSPGQYLVVIETPNRLWWEDDHTSFEPFFHWLPDDLAILYAPRTPREKFNQHFCNPGPPPPDALIDLARWGRGASFHEFALALGLPATELPVSSCLHEYLGNPRWNSRNPDGQYMHLLHGAALSVPTAFFFSYLDLALRRP